MPPFVPIYLDPTRGLQYEFHRRSQLCAVQQSAKQRSVVEYLGHWKDDGKLKKKQTKHFLSIRHPLIPQGIVAPSGSSKTTKTFILPPIHAMCGSGRPFMRIAALSGVSALAIHWYYVHFHQQKKYKLMGLSINDQEDIYSPDSFLSDTKQVFLSVNMFHFMHSVAMLSVPLCRSPVFVSKTARQEFHPQI